MDLLEMEEPARVNYILKQLIVECFSWGAFYVTVAPSQLYLKNTALFLRLGSPSTLICLEPRSFTKTLFLGNEKWHFENGIHGRIKQKLSFLAATQNLEKLLTFESHFVLDYNLKYDVVFAI